MTYLVSVLLLVILGFGLLKKDGTLISPRVLFAFYWAALFCVQSVSELRYSVQSFTFIVIMGLVATFALGQQYAKRVFKSNQLASFASDAVKPELSFVLFFSLLAVPAIGALFIDLEWSPLLMFDFDALKRMSSIMSTGRYTGQSEPVGFRMLITSQYIAAVLGGVYFATARRFWYRVLAFTPLFTSFWVVLFVTTRTVFLMALVCWASGYLAVSLILPPEIKKSNFRFLSVVAALLLLALVPGMVYVQMLRYSISDFSNFFPQMRFLLIDVMNFLVPFSEWLSTFMSSAYDLPTLGRYSFAGPLNLLGVQERMPGLFADHVLLAMGRTSNLYTFFRYIIEDWGLVGSVLWFFGWGFISGVSFMGTLRGHALSIPVLSGTYFIIFYSPLNFPPSYNTVLMAWFAFAIYLEVLKPPTVKRHVPC